MATLLTNDKAKETYNQLLQDTNKITKPFCQGYFEQDGQYLAFNNSTGQFEVEYLDTKEDCENYFKHN